MNTRTHTKVYLIEPHKLKAWFFHMKLYKTVRKNALTTRKNLHNARKLLHI